MLQIPSDVFDAALDEAAQAEILALARRQSEAAGAIMRAVTSFGGQIEVGMKALPAPLRRALENAAKTALQRSYDLAGRTRGTGIVARTLRGDRAHRLLASASGALGGIGGLATALAELPIATTVIFRAVQEVAASYGEDPSSPQTRIECLRVFGSGGPSEGDDGIDTTFIGARLALSGTAVSNLIATIAPRFAAVFSQKLATQAVPVLGAAAGAGTNYIFTRYYIEMAHVHFGLRALAQRHGEEAVLGLFHQALLEPKRLNTRG